MQITMKKMGSKVLLWAVKYLDIGDTASFKSFPKFKHFSGFEKQPTELEHLQGPVGTLSESTMLHCVINLGN